MIEPGFISQNLTLMLWPLKISVTDFCAEMITLHITSSPQRPQSMILEHCIGLLIIVPRVGDLQLSLQRMESVSQIVPLHRNYLEDQ